MRISTDSGLKTPTEVFRALSTDVEFISASAVTVVDDWHGKMISFTGACTVTVPAGLRSDFSCGWRQGGVGTVTFQAGSGATLNSLNSMLSSAGRYAKGGLTMFADDVLDLDGSLT